MIALAGAQNAAEAIDGYKPMNEEAILTAAPDVILMMDRGGETAAPSDIFAGPPYSMIPAAQGKALVRMDALLLLGFGPRTPRCGPAVDAPDLPRPRARHRQTAMALTGPAAPAAAIQRAQRRRQFSFALAIALLLASAFSGAFGGGRAAYPSRMRWPTGFPRQKVRR